ncbi:MAG TPA: rhomboid family intramembrane serine protease [Polyangiaceae bacterium]|nr:rhomboid family intramembrane serine protease [Polyangiaceae bacterium]
MFPLSVDTATGRETRMTLAVLLSLAGVWLIFQGAGFDAKVLAASVCNLGLVAGEITHRAAIGTAVPIGDGMACVVDAEKINYLTPLTSMFLHGSWAHIVGNALFLWVFGPSIEARMRPLAYVGFYLLCGLIAAAAQVLANPGSPVPMVGASGAISGILGAFLVLYPKARVNMLVILFIFIRVVSLPAWLVLVYWFGIQLLTALPELAGAQTSVPSEVAVMAHVGGFIAGVVLVKAFDVQTDVSSRHRFSRAAR